MNADSWTVTVDEALRDPHVLANAETIVHSPGSTIVPERTATDERIEALLLELGAATRGGIDEKLRIEGLLGEGGMGVVRLATQPALGRKVALKTLKAGVRDASAIEKMLHEALITSHVEHPNVVPLHEILLDAQGRPAIVMKRIEGQSWDQLMFDARAVERRFGASDLREWNLQILAQVTSAVAYAHARGIVHRDLKPENVMIGEFGEIYLVDWGLALAVDPDVDPRLPRRTEVEPLAGTPCYMAPEMLGGEGARITRATDVYLLGGILYEIVHGAPPHIGETLQAMIESISRSWPKLSPGLSTELVALLRRALDVDPHARFENAAQFRHALLAYTKHQGSRRLAAEASLRRVQLEAAIEAYGRGEAVDVTTLQASYAEARFGYQQALRAWPENHAAAEALRELVVSVANFDLARDEPRVAAVNIAGFEGTLPELARRVEEALKESDRAQAKLVAFSRDFDPRAGRGTRSLVTAIVGSLWTISPQLKSLPYLRDIPEGDALVLLPMLYLGVLTLALIAARRAILESAINRFLAAFVGTVLVTEMMIAFAARSFGHPAEDVYRLNFPLWALASGTVALATQARMAIASLGYMAGFFHLMRSPEDRFLVASLCNGLTTILAILVWMPETAAARVLDRFVPIRGRSFFGLPSSETSEEKRGP